MPELTFSHLEQEVKRVLIEAYPTNMLKSAEEIFREVSKSIGPRFRITDIATALTNLFIRGMVTRHTVDGATLYKYVSPTSSASVDPLDDDLIAYCAPC
jgi:predicted transcriptional regulator